MAHGGPDCCLGAYTGMGIAAEAAREPGIPDIGIHLLLRVEGLHTASENSDPPAEPCEGKKHGCGTARQGNAGGGRKSRDAEVGCAARSQTGGRSTSAELGGRSDHAVDSAVGHGAQQCAAQWTELGSRASPRCDRTNQGSGGIAAGRNRRSTRGRAGSRERPHARRSGSAQCSCAAAIVGGNVSNTGKSGRGECLGSRPTAIIGVAGIAGCWTARSYSWRRGRASASVD